ncbi:hypothetical protein HMPREF9709_00473 [Helcococcus kunzii ATCC 51366]|uniref:ABC transmembrane type-1 domain-containing protein n=1 Tax=Helcococcus kunzii ATCC 51366 TaxID=883114 RepID=H3NMB2_9FIRM|nr:ABC transporter permease [Helcococcus kunzii]EHR35521.1 hypothetical protein HMPREF9709_00473 [Helcococcus kunzii ATCC 51366]
MKKTRQLAYPYIFYVVVFIVVPLFMVLYYSFTKNGGFTFENFRKISEPSTIKTLVTSFRIALITTVVSLIVGYPFAYFMSKMNLRFRTAAMMLIMVPMWMNFLLRSYAWVTILSPNGVLDKGLALLGIKYNSFMYTESAVVLGMVYNFLPFMILPIYTALEKIDYGLIEAASDLGANAGQTFRKVIFPMSLPGVFSGLTMVFVPVISTFEVSTLLGGGMVNMVGNVIERQFTKTQNWGYGSALAAVLMVIILISMLFDRESIETGGKNE